VDSQGQTVDFLLSTSREAEAAERFFRKVLKARHTISPRVITMGQNPAYPRVFDVLQQDGTLLKTCVLRQCKYLNDVVEQDHSFIKGRVNPGLRFGAFATAQRAIQSDEAMHMFRKGQLKGIARGMSSPSTNSSTSWSGWRHNESSPASPHTPISFCNTTRLPTYRRCGAGSLG
jgi:transposase-like protein